MNTAVESAVEWPKWEDPAFYMQDNETIAAQMAAQRRAAPVHWYESPQLTTGVWVLTKWHHSRFVEGRPDLFSIELGFQIGDATQPEVVMPHLPEWTRDELSKPGLSHAQVRGLIARGKLSLGDPNFVNMVLLDPPRHGQVRDIFMKALRPSLVRSLRPRIAEITDEFLDRIEPGTEVDFVTTIGRIPAMLMTELIGVPRDMREEFIAMAKNHLAAITITPDRDPEEVQRIRQAEAKFQAYCDELLVERRASGGEGEDLISAIAQSQLDGKPVPRGLAVVYITHFIVAGETTRDMLSFFAKSMAEYPDQRRLLAERPELIGNAIEETLRCYPDSWAHCRTAKQDLEIDGQRIVKDDYVMAVFASANRDEDAYERSEEYDITRSFDHDHLGFGHGEHSCPGALLTRVDAGVIIGRLMSRFPNWEITGTPKRWATPFLQGMATLPLTFSR
jgi:cytochrome P450